MKDKTKKETFEIYGTIFLKKANDNDGFDTGGAYGVEFDIIKKI